MHSVVSVTSCFVAQMVVFALPVSSLFPMLFLVTSNVMAFWLIFHWMYSVHRVAKSTKNTIKLLKNPFPYRNLDCESNKNNCVLSNAGLSNAPPKTGICTSLKSNFYFSGFIHHWIQSHHCWILSVYGIWCWSVEKCDDQSLKTAEIWICTSLKLANYFQFVSQRTGVDATTWAACKICWKSVKNCGRNT